MSTQPTITLNDGQSMPQLGFGVWQVPDDQAESAVAEALRVGYRLIDTAAMYGNEYGVGSAISDSGVPREEIFLTTKLDNAGHGYDEALGEFAGSLDRLGLDYVDLYLIHWPLPAKNRYVETWKALAELQRSGKVRSIGVSNFQRPHLEHIVDATGVTPAVNQIEVHPYLTQEPLRAFGAARGIVTEDWSPLGSGHGLLDDPLLASLAGKYGQTPAQIVLAWHLAIGSVVIPKSVTPSRIAENFAVFDIELDPDDVIAVSGLNRDERTGPNPDTFNP